MQPSGNVSIFDSCNGTAVVVGFGVREASGVDVCSGTAGGVPVSLAAGAFAVAEGMAGVQAGRKNRIDAVQIRILVNMLKLLLEPLGTGIAIGAKTQTVDNQYNDPIRKVKRQ